ncbi:hypothetical protein ACFCY8_10300 [Streptomyces noursei]|uniref:hypothetical protein n=1 Tax=Streptomyces noursei TaxID=1971 RepID=UPI0035E259CA
MSAKAELTACGPAEAEAEAPMSHREAVALRRSFRAEEPEHVSLTGPWGEPHIEEAWSDVAGFLAGSAASPTDRELTDFRTRLRNDVAIVTALAEQRALADADLALRIEQLRRLWWSRPQQMSLLAYLRMLARRLEQLLTLVFPELELTGAVASSAPEVVLGRPLPPSLG